MSNDAWILLWVAIFALPTADRWLVLMLAGRRRWR